MELSSVLVQLFIGLAFNNSFFIVYLIPVRFVGWGFLYCDYKIIKKSCKSTDLQLFCGERGIRTPGTSQYNGFQDRRDRPLCHLSKTSFQKCFPSKAMQRYDLFFNLQVFEELFLCLCVLVLKTTPYIL